MCACVGVGGDVNECEGMWVCVCVREIGCVCVVEVCVLIFESQS